MILKGSQRAGGKQLAVHLLNSRDNDHVTVHEVRGFVASDLRDAFNEAYAISQGTKCRQFLFSLSLSPPEHAAVPVDAFESTIEKIEAKIGLTGQPRAIVFHEKDGRRHAHCVWSRIDIDTMKAVNLPHFKLKLRDMSRQLYQEHQWKMPRGLMNSKEADPLNFSLAEWQQAKRNHIDPRLIKEMFQDCWAVSDSRPAFARALEERGYYLAKGDRRGHVAVDWRGEVYAISRMLGIRSKDVAARLGDPAPLPSVEETRERIADGIGSRAIRLEQEADAQYQKASQGFQLKRGNLVMRQRKTRRELEEKQDARRIQENKERAVRLPTGLRGLWHRITGQYRQIKEENERAAAIEQVRDRQEMEQLITRQVGERRLLQEEVKRARQIYARHLRKLRKEPDRFNAMFSDAASHSQPRRRRER